MLLSQRRVQQILGVLWLIDGLLQLQPQMFTLNMVYETMMPTLQNQPAPVSASLQWVIEVTMHHLVLVNLFIAGVQFAIGLSLLLGHRIRGVLIVSMVWALIVWYGSEGMGLLFTGQASVLTGTPGAFLLYALLGLAAYPRYASPRTSEDASECGLLSRIHLRWILAGLWCLAVLLQLQPSWWVLGQISGSIAVMMDGGGLNRILVDPILGQISMLTAQIGIPLSSVLILLFLALGIALAIVKETWLRPWLVVSMVISLAIWWICQAFGNLLTGMTTDTNSGLVLFIIALACWPHPSLSGTMQGRSADEVELQADEELLTSPNGVGLDGRYHQTIGTLVSVLAVACPCLLHTVMIPWMTLCRARHCQSIRREAAHDPFQRTEALFSHP